jgi:hypothetical protein
MDSYSIIMIITIALSCIRYSYYKYKIKNVDLTNSLLLYNDEVKYTLFDDENDIENKEYNDTSVNTENDNLYYNPDYIDNSLNQTVSTIATDELFMNTSLTNSIINSELTDTSITTINSIISDDNLTIEDNKVIKNELFLSFSHN